MLFYQECKTCGCVFSAPDGSIVFPKYRLPFLTNELSTCNWFVEVAQGMKVKLWFESLVLAKNSSLVIRNGNSSTSKILKTITSKDDEGQDIYSTSNVMSIWYSNDGILNGVNRTGFQISYVSVGE